MPQLGDRLRLTFEAGLGFGLGFETTDRYGANGLSSVGTFGWGGAYGSSYRSDPEARLTLVLMIQLIPNRTDIAQKFPRYEPAA